ncbi:syndecan-3-like [Parambassis ranga]|uniref:Syndecan-3-like n=1 Tax=Parambassis ranga TaxID=210632 RepID=A0A6P7HMJ7_9TELE|nr:syndecan-3-like [Parambassis ranga]
MRLSVTASLFITFGLIHPINSLLSASPEDLEGSGYDLDSSGSGSGDGSDPDKTESNTVNSEDVRLLAAGGGNDNTLHGSSGLTFDSTLWPAGDSGFVFIESSKWPWERPDIHAALIAGGVTGAILAAMLMAVLIYQMQNHDEEGPILAWKKDANEGYHKPTRDVIV